MADDRDISRRALMFGRWFRRAGDDAGGGDRSGPDAASHGPGAPAPGPARTRLRPPGAIDEPAFLEGCTRCNDCAAACPVQAIFPADDRSGPAAGTPVIDPMRSPCVMCEDTPCIAACEPGVLSPEAPIAMGTARIDPGHCLAHMSTTCTVCFERCPVPGAIAVDERGRPQIDADACTGCGVCQHVCPAPYNAVTILPAPRGADGGSDAPVSDDPASTDGDGGAFDWRRAYLGDRRLSPPEDLWDESR